MKKIPSLLFILAVLFSVVAQAQKPTERAFAESEQTNLDIAMSSKNTGVVHDITCSYCNFNFVKITPATKAFAKGKEVNLSLAASRYGKTAFLRFNTKTGDVVFISWDE